VELNWIELNRDSSSLADSNVVMDLMPTQLYVLKKGELNRRLVHYGFWNITDSPKLPVLKDITAESWSGRSASAAPDLTGNDVVLGDIDCQKAGASSEEVGGYHAQLRPKLPMYWASTMSFIWARLSWLLPTKFRPDKAIDGGLRLT
jgi:hypothetical protein